MEGRQHGDSLGRFEPGQTLQVSLGSKIEHLHRVVAERCDEGSLRVAVDGQVIDAALHAGQFNCANLDQRLLR
jgi:hypothetical protein